MGVLGHVATFNCQGNLEVMSLFWRAVSPAKSVRFHSTEGNMDIEAHPTALTWGPNAVSERPMVVSGPVYRL